MKHTSLALATFALVLFAIPELASARMLWTEPQFAELTRNFVARPTRRHIMESERAHRHEIGDVRRLYRNDLSLRRKERRAHRIWNWYNRNNDGAPINDTQEYGDAYNNAWGQRFIDNRLRQGGPPSRRNLKFQYNQQLRHFQVQDESTR